MKKRKTKSGPKSKIAARGKKIMQAAKKIRSKNPRKKWQSCVKEAAKKCF
jgi:hypothetical protein